MSDNPAKRDGKAPAENISAAKAQKLKEKEERRKQKELELKMKGIDIKGETNKLKKTKAERRAHQEQLKQAKQTSANNDNMRGDTKTDPATAHASGGAADLGHSEQKKVDMTNRVVPEDKRMYLYLHLDTPQHPPSSYTDLDLEQSKDAGGTSMGEAVAEHNIGDAETFVAGIRNAEFPPGPHVVLGMSRGDYVAAERRQPVKASVPGTDGNMAEAILQDAIPPFSTRPGQRKIPKRTANLKGIAIHPRIKDIGLRMATMEVTGSNARVVAVLAAFTHVIADYVVPPDMELNRNIVHHLSAQINFLVYQRPMCTGLGNAMRWLKSEAIALPSDMNDDVAKNHLITMIGDYIRERITAAGDVIADSGADKIQDGDVILTYGISSTVQRLLLTAHAMGRRFRVIVVDCRPHNDGRKLVRRLVEADLSNLDSNETSKDNSDVDSEQNISYTNYTSNVKGRGRNGLSGGITYAPITALSFLMRDVSKVFLGAEAFFANGAMLSRSGTSMVALAAHSFHVPVIVACETYKFSENIQLDAVVNNELGVPDALMYKTGVPGAEPVGIQSDPRLSEMEYSAYARDRYAARPRWNNCNGMENNSSTAIGAATQIKKGKGKGKGGRGGGGGAPATIMTAEEKTQAELHKTCPLSDWRTTQNLRLMSISQDVTPPEFVSVIITEVGMIPTTSIPVVLREYKNQT